MSATQTPITKEALIELGFEEKSRDGWVRTNGHSTVKVYLFKDGIELALISDIEYQESVPLRNLKSIEQLKTIIEVCL